MTVYEGAVRSRFTVDGLRRLTGGVGYYVLDWFQTQEAAPIASPRTPESQSDRILLVQAGGWEYEITAGEVLQTLPGIAPGFDQAGVFSEQAYPRSPGTIFQFDYFVDKDNLAPLVGWSVDQNPNYMGVSGSTLMMLAGGTLERWTSGNNFVVGLWSQNVLYSFSSIQRAAGSFLCVKGGAYADWTLLWMDRAGSETPLYASLPQFNALGYYDNFIVGPTTYAPKAIASDSFNRDDSFNDLGFTDGLGHPEGQATNIPGSGLQWSQAPVAPFSIVNNLCTTTDSGGSQIAAATVDAGAADCLLRVMTRTNGAIGVAFRVQTAEDLWYVHLDVAGDKLELIELTAGVPTVHQQMLTAGLVSLQDYEITIIPVGTDINVFLDGNLVLTHAGATGKQGETRHGLYSLGFESYSEDFVVFPRILTDYPTFDVR